MNQDRNRGTGRTTQMLKNAIRIWHSGQSVRIIVANTYKIQRMKHQIYELTEDVWLAQQMLNSTKRPRIVFTPIHDRHFHLEVMRYDGCHHHILIDHYALEAYYNRLPRPPISRDFNTLHRLTNEALAEHPIKETIVTDRTGFPTHTHQDTKDFVDCLTQKISKTFSKPDFVVREENIYLHQQLAAYINHVNHLTDITAVSKLVAPYQESK
jgi:hypothetical protein